MREHGWLPWQIDRMTLSEITVALMDAKSRKPSQSRGEIEAHLRHWQRLTPRQRIEDGLRRQR